MPAANRFFASDGEDEWTIQLQSGDRRGTGRRESTSSRPIPPKMLHPFLCSRIKQV